MPEFLGLDIEVSGCPTACMHCCARGKLYQSMLFDDISIVLEHATQFCSDNELSLYAYPLHEVLAHPRAPEIMSSFKKTCGISFEPLPTTGVPLATMDNWRKMLEDVKSLGTTAIWFAFHGMGNVHDRQVNRLGAFEETCIAVERARSMGFKCGCNVFLTRENVPQFHEMLQLFQKIGIKEIIWDVADYYPIARLRRSEDIRPELDDLLPLVESMIATSKHYRNVWSNLRAHTEEAHFDRATNGASEDDSEWTFRKGGLSSDLVCRNNLDVHCGKAGLYGKFLGNIKKDKPGQIFQTALESSPYSDDVLYFSTQAIPSIHDAAQRFGNLHGQKIYRHPASMRNRWLDLGLAEHRRY